MHVKRTCAVKYLFILYTHKKCITTPLNVKKANTLNRHVTQNVVVSSAYNITAYHLTPHALHATVLALCSTLLPTSRTVSSVSVIVRISTQEDWLTSFVINTTACTSTLSTAILLSFSLKMSNYNLRRYLDSLLWIFLACSCADGFSCWLLEICPRSSLKILWRNAV